MHARLNVLVPPVLLAAFVELICFLLGECIGLSIHVLVLFCHSDEVSLLEVLRISEVLSHLPLHLGVLDKVRVLGCVDHRVLEDFHGVSLSAVALMEEVQLVEVLQPLVVGVREVDLAPADVLVGAEHLKHQPRVVALVLQVAALHPLQLAHQLHRAVVLPHLVVEVPVQRALLPCVVRGVSLHVLEP